MRRADRLHECVDFPPGLIPDLLPERIVTCDAIRLSLPEAILKCRQGVGRLLRSRTDRGMVTILDSRVLTRQYGRMFVTSLPPCPVQVISADGETEYLTTENL